jgi:hypothetical protein
MPILGNLAEFPLPEILLLIGQRTGRLRLLDVPGSNYGIIDIDMGRGEVYCVHLSGRTVVELEDILSSLTSVVQSRGGMFEFTLLTLPHAGRNPPVLINHLVMSLVYKVDEQMADEQMQDRPDDVYILEQPDPEMWIEPDLAIFFNRAKDLLQHGARWDELAAHLNMDVDQVRQNLVNLRLLGVVNLMDELEKTNHSATSPLPAPKDLISPNTGDIVESLPGNMGKSILFPKVSKAAVELRRITGRLPKFLQD